MKRTVEEMIGYLKGFPKDSKCNVIVADPEKGKRYDTEAAVVIDSEEPLLVLKICGEQDINQEVITEIRREMKKGERPEVIWKDEKKVRYMCPNCGRIADVRRENWEKRKLSHCTWCGQKLNWED